MDVRLLRYFLAVAREENISKAAESLHVSQPSLSRQLRGLEQEIGKPLLIRGKRKTTLTEDGIFLRKRAEEVLALLEKTERELRGGGDRIIGEISVGGNPTSSLLRVASETRTKHPGIRFQFYGGDAIDVLERLDHGSLDFAVFLKPIDTTKYAYLSLPDTSCWGLLLPSVHPLAKKGRIEKADLLTVPLVIHRRAGLQTLIAHWAEVESDELRIAASYNVINGSPEKFVESGLGAYLTTEDLLPARLDSDLQFVPLYPLLGIQYALIWKRYAAHTRAGDTFLQAFRDMVRKE